MAASSSVQPSLPPFGPERPAGHGADGESPVELLRFVSRAFSGVASVRFKPAPDGKWCCTIPKDGVAAFNDYVSGTIDSLSGIPPGLFRPDTIFFGRESLDPERRDEALVYTQHETAHIRFTDFRLMAEGLRGATDGGALASSWLLAYNALEDAWVDNRHGRDYPAVLVRRVRHVAQRIEAIRSDMKSLPLMRQWGFATLARWAIGDDLADAVDPRVSAAVSATADWVDEYHNGKNPERNAALLRTRIWPAIRHLESADVRDNVDKPSDTSSRAQGEGDTAPQSNSSRGADSASSGRSGSSGNTELSGGDANQPEDGPGGCSGSKSPASASSEATESGASESVAASSLDAADTGDVDTPPSDGSDGVGVEGKGPRDDGANDVDVAEPSDATAPPPGESSPRPNARGEAGERTTTDARAENTETDEASEAASDETRDDEGDLEHPSGQSIAAAKESDPTGEEAGQDTDENAHDEDPPPLDSGIRQESIGNGVTTATPSSAEVTGSSDRELPQISDSPVSPRDSEGRTQTPSERGPADEAAAREEVDRRQCFELENELPSAVEMVTDTCGGARIRARREPAEMDTDGIGNLPVSGEQTTDSTDVPDSIEALDGGEAAENAAPSSELAWHSIPLPSPTIVDAERNGFSADEFALYSEYLRLESKARPYVVALERKLSRVLPRDLDRRKEGGFRSGKSVDSRSLAARISSGDPRIMTRGVDASIGHPRLIVQMFVDNTGSMLGEKIVQSKIAAVCLSEVLARANVGFRLAAFGEAIIPIKDVGEDFHNRLFRIKPRLMSNMDASHRCTDIESAVREADLRSSEFLRVDPEQLQALLLVTDGGANAGATGLQLRSLVDEVSSRMIIVPFALRVSLPERRTLEDVFGTGRLVCLDRFEEIVGAASRVIGELVGRAMKSRK